MSFIFNHSTPTTGAVAVYELKELLVDAGWTVKSSGDGIGAYSSSGDVITSGLDVVSGGLGNEYAWFRIKEPTGTGAHKREFTFQRGGGVYDANGYWRIKYSHEDTFTGAPIGGGSSDTDTTPSATDEAIIVGNGDDATPIAIVIFPADGCYRWNIGADNAANYGW